MWGDFVCFLFLVWVVVRWVSGGDCVCLGGVGSNRVCFCVGLMLPMFVVLVGEMYYYWESLV